MGHYLLGRGMVGIGSLAVALLLVRVLPVEVYGAYTALAGLHLTLSIMSDAGIERVVPKFYPMLRIANAETRLAQLCWKLLSFRTLLILVALIPVFLAPDWITSLLSIEEGTAVIWPFTLYVVLWVVSAYLARTLQSLLQQRDVTRGMALEWFTKLAGMLMVLGFMGTLPLVAVTWIQAVTVGLGALFLFVKLRQHLKEFASAGHPQKEIDLPAERLWRFGWHNYLPNLVNIIFSDGTIKLVSAYYLGIATTAALGFAYAIAGVCKQYLPAVLMMGLIEPAFMARYTERRNFTVLNELASIVLKSNIFVLAPAAVWLLLSGTPLVGLVSGGKYLDTVWLLSGLIGILMMHSHYLVLTLIVNAIEESKLLFACNAWASLFALAQIVALATFGLPGLLIGLFFTSGFKNTYLAVKVRSKNYPYKPDWSGVARIVILAIISGFAGSLALHWLPGVLGSLVSLVITSILFLALTYLWKPFKQVERDLLNRFVGKKVFVW